MSLPDALPPGLLIQPPMAPPALDAAIASARDKGWWVAHSGSLAGDNRLDLLRRLGTVLGCPQWYRPNWDAFSDCLHDLSWLQEAPRLLIVEVGRSPRNHGERETEDWIETLVEILARACWYWADTTSPLTVVLTG